MRILVDCRHLNNQEPSGVGEYTIQLLAALFAISQTHEYILLTSGKEQPDLLTLFRSRTSPLFSFPSFVTHQHVREPNKFLNAKLLLWQKPVITDLVPLPVDLVFLPNLNIVSLPKGIPSILTIHDVSWKFFPEFFSKKMLLWHKLLRPQTLIRFSHIITPSKTTANDVARLFHKPENEITSIAHGISEAFCPKQESRDHGVRSKYKLPKRFALFVGTIEPRKNLLTVIEGMKMYREQTHDDIQLVVVGKWGWKSHGIRRRIWKRDVKDWVHVLDYVQAKDLPAIYRSASVFVWPSFYEGFGLPLLEAMASGTPVITSNISSLPEVTSTAALHVDPFNIQDTADALKGLLSSKSLQEQLRKTGIEHAYTFSWKQAAEYTLSVFEKSLK